MSLAPLVASTLDHRRVPAPVDPRLRCGAAAGLGLSLLASGEATLATVADWPGPHNPGWYVFGWAVTRWALTVGGHPVVLAVAATAAALAGLVGAATTRGFTTAGVHGQVGLFILLLAGMVLAAPLTLAVAVTLANVALWCALILLGAIVLGFILMALLDNL